MNATAPTGLRESQEKELLLRLAAPNIPASEMRSISEQITTLTKAAYQNLTNLTVHKRDKLFPAEQAFLDDIYEEVSSHFPATPLHILDIGAGNGLKASHLAQHKNVHSHAIDNIAPSPPPLKHINFILADMTDIPMEDAYAHLILHHATLHHLPLFDSPSFGLLKALYESKRLLKAGGLIDIVVKYGELPFFDKNGRFFHPFTEDTMRPLIEKSGLKLFKQAVFELPHARVGWEKWLNLRLKK